MFPASHYALTLAHELTTSYLPLDGKLKAALCREPNNEYLPLLELAEALEENRWGEAEVMIQRLSLDMVKVRAAYQQAVQWATTVAGLSDHRPE